MGHAASLDLQATQVDEQTFKSLLSDHYSPHLFHFLSNPKSNGKISENDRNDAKHLDEDFYKSKKSLISADNMIKFIRKATDVFVSFEQSDDSVGRSNTKRAELLISGLRSNGFKVSSSNDKEVDESDVLSRIDHAACIVMFLTKNYMKKVTGDVIKGKKDDIFCEVQHMEETKKSYCKFISVVMEPELLNKDIWDKSISSLVSDDFFIDFSDDSISQIAIKELCYKIKASIVSTVQNKFESILNSIDIKLEIGTRVEANFRNKGEYRPGKVRRDRGDGSYDIDYDDGSLEIRLKPNRLRLVAPRYEEGCKVDANYRGKGKYYPAYIIKDRGDNTYDINYDDGETEFKVHADFIRRNNSSRLAHKSAFPVGTIVVANYRNRGKFYPGIICLDREDGTFDVDYDDGEKEIRVPSDLIRSKRT